MRSSMLSFHLFHRTPAILARGIRNAEYRERNLATLVRADVVDERLVMRVEAPGAQQGNFYGAKTHVHLAVQRERHVTKTTRDEPGTVDGTWPDQHNFATSLRHTPQFGQPSIATLDRFRRKSRARKSDINALCC